MKNHRMGRSRMRIPGTRALFGGALLALSLSLGSFGCEAQSAEPTGGETHFLRLCDPEGSDCGADLVCICGVCTTDCSVEDPCATFPGAQCVVPPPSCSPPVARSCDVECRSNEECWGLSGNHFCIDGWCRLASGASLPKGTGGTSEQPPTSCDPSGVLGNEVVIIGDSFFATTHEVTAYLETYARAAGALSDGERYRDYSNLTANSLVVSENGILAQYQTARDEASVRIVIMNGGGADVLFGVCDPVDAECPALVDAASALEEVFVAMDEGGVEAAVFVSYPDPQVPEVFEKMEILRPMLEDACAASSVPCSFLDLRESFSGNESEFILDDGLNPTTEGSQAAAAAIWDVMLESCIAQ